MNVRVFATKLRALGWRGTLQALDGRLRARVGAPAAMKVPDRILLEQTILPRVDAHAAGGRVLLVGCDWYAAHYPRLLPHCACTSIDPDPARARYGVSGHHHRALLQDLDRLEPEQAFAAIVCNGVYGWGLDRLADCERAFEVCRSRLRPGGWLVLGWNDVPERDPAPLAAVRSLAAFEPLVLPALGAARLTVQGSANRHTYASFRRPQ